MNVCSYRVRRSSTPPPFWESTRAGGQSLYQSTKIFISTTARTRRSIASSLARASSTYCSASVPEFASGPSSGRPACGPSGHRGRHQSKDHPPPEALPNCAKTCFTISGSAHADCTKGRCRA